jgi:hypothetical protein
MRQTKLWAAALAAAVALAGLAFFAGCAKKAEEPVAAATYTCPMHPDVKSDKPGECPQCGMDLVPVEKGEHGSGEMPEHSGM